MGWCMVVNGLCKARRGGIAGRVNGEYRRTPVGLAHLDFGLGLIKIPLLFSPLGA